MSDPSDRCARIEAELRERLAAVHVEVVDESHLHVGHAGARDGGGHFRAVVVSMRFEGKAPVQRQRLVYDALDSAMGREIHALSMKTLTPAEWTSRG
ncbi:MAG: BolA family transcriptional regulator [Myxococcales bacterium]|nr:BolA family transcriptional regulator [Myxococcales bacterium]